MVDFLCFFWLIPLSDLAEKDVADLESKLIYGLTISNYLWIYDVYAC